jgi:hypothetical protein
LRLRTPGEAACPDATPHPAIGDLQTVCSLAAVRISSCTENYEKYFVTPIFAKVQSIAQSFSRGTTGEASFVRYVYFAS